MTSPRIFAISDPHFCHANVLTFRDLHGNLLRPEFSNVDDMDECIIRNWNNTVRPDDFVYCLGDFIFGNIKKNLARIAPRLMGRKRLIMGNHDYDASLYTPYFDIVSSWEVSSKINKNYARPMVLCHYPLDESAFAYRGRGRDLALNVHGHIHEKVVMRDGKPSPLHVNVAVEHTNYTPIDLADIANGDYISKPRKPSFQ